MDYDTEYLEEGGNKFVSILLEQAPIGIVYFDSEFKIRKVSKNFLGFNVSPFRKINELIGKNIIDDQIFTSEELTDDLKRMEDGDPFEKKLTSRTSLDGGEIIVYIKATPLYSGNEFTGGLIVLEDLKIDADSQKEHLISSNSFHYFLSGLSDFFLIAGTNRDVVYKPLVRYDRQYDIILEKAETSVNQIFSYTSKDKVDKLFSNLERKNESVSADLPFHIDKKRFNLRVTLAPFLNSMNEIQFVIVLFKNLADEITDRRREEQEQSELIEYQHIAAGLVDSVISLDPEGKITFWNDAAANLFGFTKSEVFGKHIGKVIPDINRDYFEEIKEELEENKIWKNKFGIDTGRREPFDISVRMGMYSDDNFQSFVLVCTDVTEKEKAENELKQSEERFRNIVSNITEYICTLDLEGKIIYANQYFCDTFQYSPEEIVQQKFKYLLDPSVKHSKQLKFKSDDLEKISSSELQLLTKDGTKIYVSASFIPVSGSDGKPKYFNVILNDITQQKETEKDLLLIRSIFESSPEGIAVWHKRKLVLVNDLFASMFGYARVSDILGMDPLDFVLDEDIPRVAKYIQAYEKLEKVPDRFEFVGKKRDGSNFYVQNSGTIYQREDDIYIVFVLRDITEEKKAQEALEESEERYRSITENINESMWAAEREGENVKVIFYTDAIKKITGYTSDEFLSNFRLWYKIIHPEDVDIILPKMKRLYKDEVRNFDEFEYRIINKEGNTIWVKNKISIIRDAKGEIEKIYGILSDITSGKKAEEELKSSAEDLKRLNETKDKFISIISHDLRTPFSSIMGYTDILLGQKDLTQEKKNEYITFIRESSKNMLTLVNSLLDWTRIQTGRIKFEPDRINSKTLIEKSIQMQQGNALVKGVKIFSEVSRDLFIHADENLLLQVFNNLISNATKFTKPDGVITVAATLLVDKRAIQFGVKDTGVGIKPEDLEKLFKVDSKFTTKGTSGEKGSGLGLSLCYDIVRKHGGEIWAESDYGFGTEMFFTIPISSTKVLLVDDMRTDRVLYSKLLRSIIPGYTIIEAENGQEAFEILEQSPPALIITDHKMPVMNGYDFVKKLNDSNIKFKPPVIILSGDIIDAVIEEYNELGVEYVFRKPVDLSIFKKAIDDSLKKAMGV